MVKKIVALVIVLAIIGGAAYAIFHKSPAKTPSSSSSSSQQSSTSTSGPIIQTKTSSNFGSYLADSNSLPLYTYGGDTSGVSNCSGACLYSWPIYDASNAPATLPANVTVITRSDGSKQYAYRGLPLYTFSSDSAGQPTGDNVSDFHLAKP